MEINIGKMAQEMRNKSNPCDSCGDLSYNTYSNKLEEWICKKCSYKTEGDLK